MTRPEIAHAITVLHRADGHLRFRLPPALAREPAGPHLRRALLRLGGVRRVAVDRGRATLAVHFDAHTQTVGDIARALQAAAREAAVLPPVPLEGGAAAERTRLGKAVPWLIRRAQAVRRRYRTVVVQARTLTTAAGDELARRSPLARALGPVLLNERTVLNTLNDITALYLIKVHWNLITQRWLRAPFAHRYEWLTIAYLTYLFVRFRKQMLNER